uniref:Peptidase M13 C-terminal domain-containing protein n=2 Tax=Clastoptera arizonana TaxID=38151 RepID=A0A1B6E096_9HEMI
MFNETGAPVNWFKNQTEKEFLKRMQCIIDDANKYIIPDVNLRLNGKNCQGENVADIGGAKLSLLAYDSWVADHGKELGFAGFKPRQLYWLSVANLWCTKYSRQALTLQATSHHPPTEYRVNNMVRNHEGFAKEFHCPVGSKMNPRKKCKVW